MTQNYVTYTCLTGHKHDKDVFYFAAHSKIKSHGIDKVPGDRRDISGIVFVCFEGICEKVESRSVHLMLFINKRECR